MGSNNDNVSVNVLTPNNTNNDNGKYDKSRLAEQIAWKLVDKFNAKDSFEFYCKVAYRLPESKIWLNYEKCTKGKNVTNPAGLFNWLCRRDMNGTN